jgi:hypothetical protein
VEIDFHWRFCYTNRQWKYPISTGGCVTITASGNMFPLAVPKPGPPSFFYWRAVTETASDNLWVPQALSSFLLVRVFVSFILSQPVHITVVSTLHSSLTVIFFLLFFMFMHEYMINVFDFRDQI